MARFFQTVLIAGLALFNLPNVQAEDSIIVASTTSTQNSGLFKFILPQFTQKTGIQVKVIAQGTGQALETGRRGDADVLFVHNRVAEDQFIAQGYGVNRKDVMYNDFVIIGTKTDPARVKNSNNVSQAFRAIAQHNATFISRGDNSGTHAAEKRFWATANIDPKSFANYRQSGSGMGATLNVAAAMDAYTLSDRGTWLSFKNRQNLAIVFQDQPPLFNPYGIILVNPDKHPHVKKAQGMTFIEWITSTEGQTAINAYKINGQQLFFTNAF